MSEMDPTLPATADGIGTGEDSNGPVVCIWGGGDVSREQRLHVYNIIIDGQRQGKWIPILQQSYTHIELSRTGILRDHESGFPTRSTNFGQRSLRKYKSGKC